MHTDSTYVIRGIREWNHAWRRRGWKTVEGKDVVNRDLWEELAALARTRRGREVEWHFVRGHSGIPGNERVDEIAEGNAAGRAAGALSRPPRPLRGRGDGHPRGHAHARRGRRAAGAAKKTPAYSYLSLVDGQLMRHATWAECERRVKGRSGARFKKATSAADEAAILRDWGVEKDR